jgi:hypothetical protein
MQRIVYTSASATASMSHNTSTHLVRSIAAAAATLLVIALAVHVLHTSELHLDRKSGEAQ